MEEKSGYVNLSDVLPIIKQGFGGLGFFFGAGASIEAGYPDLARLTTAVFQRISPSDKAIIHSVLYKSGSQSPDAQGKPDIEEIADHIQDYLMKIGDSPEKNDVKRVEGVLRDVVVETLDGIQKPNLANHIRFFEAIKKLLEGRSQTIWIITTNYDRCFEVASSLAGVNLVDGFLGTTLRYFSPDSFYYNLTTPDKIKKTHGNLWKAPTIKLIKLHGSLDWWSNDHSAFASSNNDHLPQGTLRSLVLPRRMKQSQTLDHPYNDLFSVAENILGPECQYLISCGYRFSDNHINKRLFAPKLKAGTLRVCALLSHESSKPDSLCKYSNFNVLTPESSIIDGKKDARVSQSWKFSELINEIAGYCGS